METVVQTQNDKVLRYMENHPSITSLDAFNYLGCTRLSARISDLRRKGYAIATQSVIVKNRDNKKVRVTAYSLAQEDMYE